MRRKDRALATQAGDKAVRMQADNGQSIVSRPKRKTLGRTAMLTLAADLDAASYSR